MNISIYHEELLHHYTWGSDEVILDKDINLLSKVSFDSEGFTIIDIGDYNNFLTEFIKQHIYDLTGKSIEINKYHEKITEEEHNQILHNMPYKRNDNKELSLLCKHLEDVISLTINDKIRVFNDDIWIRICRPSNISNNDYNPCHRDIYLDFYRNTLNIYFPICGSNELSSLMLEPGSHKWKESETIVTQGGAYFPKQNKKYSVDAIVASKRPLNMIRPNPDINKILLFSPYLIHGCSSNNNENETRISLEIRFIRDINQSKKQEDVIQDFLIKRIWR
jgi:ectoine hydroxylase-related dioxygenase (phytanoyl-CoA dioxygenase family)